MPNQNRVDELVLELLDSGRTPEEICRDCPELLAQVRTTWLRVRAVDAELSSILPDANGYRETLVPFDGELPQIPGYAVERVLGRGGMAIVYLARHVRLGRLVAVKMLLAGQYAKARELDRFSCEVRTLAELHHPNIIQIFDVGDYKGCPYFTMEYLNGGSLADRVKERPMPAKDAARMIATFSEAIHVAHQSGIIHRDLSPSNILFDGNGVPKITDFGLARHLQDTNGLTLTGAALGTPGYMAPEQADGRGSKTGPAKDIYSLGAVLYKLLTGRPPFQAETTASTIRQSLFDEPVRPVLLNARIPRDAETICLKCLEKDPQRRYVSAAALADDLHRFEQGEAITARPLRRLERVVRWTRRHPTRALIVAATVVAALAAAGMGGWLIGQQNRLAQQVEADLVEVLQFQQRSALPEARDSLQQAQLRLGDHGPRWIRSHLAETQENQRLLERLDAIRMTRSTLAEGRGNRPAEVRFNDARADREYQAAFRGAALGQPGGDPDAAAKRVKASAVRAPLVAALDDWAVCCIDRTAREWALSVAGSADPDAWRRRAREPAAWEDIAALAKLSETAPITDQPPPVLLALGERLHLVGGDGIGLLRRVAEQYPRDFWANFTLARALYGAFRQGKGDWKEVAAYYQKALELRPQAVAVHNNLGLVLVDVGWLEDDADGRWGPGAITIFRRALRIDPEFAPARNNLGLCMKRQGPWWLAVHEYRDALRADPELAPAHFNLGEIDAGSNRINEAIDHYREALRIDPDFVFAHYYLAVALLAKGRQDEVFEEFPANVESLNQFRGAALGDANAYYWQPYSLDPNWVAARNSLHISAPDGARLDEAIDHYREAIRLDPGWFRPHAALGQALLAKRQPAEALVAIGRSLELLPPQETKLQANIERLRERCLHLQALEGRLSNIVQNTEEPVTDDSLDAAELCFVKRYYATAARLYAEALVATPQLTADIRAGHRFNAARAESLAATGKGGDAAELSESERKHLRAQARGWLQIDLADMAKKVDSGTAADRIQVEKALSHWREDPDLAGVRDLEALDRLSADERKECDALWNQVGALLTRVRAAM